MFVFVVAYVESMAVKPVAAPVGSTIPTVVGRSVDPSSNGAAAPKRAHSPTLDEQAKRIKETEQAKIQIV